MAELREITVKHKHKDAGQMRRVASAITNGKCSEETLQVALYLAHMASKIDQAFGRGNVVAMRPRSDGPRGDAA